MRLAMHALDPIRLCDLTSEARRQERAWRSGELLRDMAERGERAGRGEKREMSHAATLGDIGITRDESSRFQQAASAPLLAGEAVERSAPDTEGIERVLDPGSVSSSST
jgi:hypothetical protein